MRSSPWGEEVLIANQRWWTRMLRATSPPDPDRPARLNGLGSAASSVSRTASATPTRASSAHLPRVTAPPPVEHRAARAVTVPSQAARSVRAAGLVGLVKVGPGSTDDAGVRLVGKKGDSDRGRDPEGGRVGRVPPAR